MVGLRKGYKDVGCSQVNPSWNDKCCSFRNPTGENWQCYMIYLVIMGFLLWSVDFVVVACVWLFAAV